MDFTGAMDKKHPKTRAGRGTAVAAGRQAREGNKYSLLFRRGVEQSPTLRRFDEGARALRACATCEVADQLELQLQVEEAQNVARFHPRRLCLRGPLQW